MMLSRRSVLALPAALVGTGDAVVLAPGEPDQVVLRHPAARDGLVMPANRARIAAHFALGGHPVVAASFGADPSADIAVDILALAALDPALPPRLIGLELLTYTDANGTKLISRVSATSDGAALILARATATSRSPTLLLRATWNDFLSWRDDAPLADAPVHPPPPRSYAALLAARRFRVRVALAGPVARITPALLRDTSLLQPLRL
jgi:hypothetical protein